jgi:methyl-accepting chemotaxis protein
MSRPSFSNLRIGTRLGLSFALLGGILVANTGLGLHRLSGLGNTFEHLLDHSVRPTLLAEKLDLEAAVAGLHLRNSILLDDAGQVKAELAGIDEARARIVKTRQELLQATDNPDSRRHLETVARQEGIYFDAVDRIARAVKAGDPEAARALLASPEVREVRQRYAQVVGELVKLEMTSMEQDRAAAQGSFVTARWLLGLMALVGLLLLVWTGWSMTRSVVLPARRATEAARRVAAGDLTEDVQTHRRDEMGELLRAIQDMQTSLRHTVSRIRAGAGQVNVASREIAAGNQDLSGRTEQQASALEETAASMQQMTDTVRQNAESARQANQLASAAVGVASRGGEVVNQVVNTMDEISGSSRKIADIIGVIDGIAFQTNILALNAAVEAARAGEQGRGFAVVAGEVRNLAQRSANAAREIKALITQSVERVESGHELVRQAGATMGEVVGGVQRVTDLIAEINAATVEQSSGITQVNSAVAHLDQGTQQNAALVEQGAAAAESLRRQAEALEQLVATFRLGHVDEGFAQRGPAIAAPAVSASTLKVARPAVSLPPSAARPAPASMPTYPVPAAPTASGNPAGSPAQTRTLATAATPAPASASVTVTDEWETF